MAWQLAERAPAGTFLMVDVVSGWNIGSPIAEDEFLARVSNFAQNWHPISVQWVRGIFGAAETLRVYGVADTETLTSAAAAQVSAAVNSFWLTGGASSIARVSPTLDIVEPSSEGWQTTIQWVAAAVLFTALAWGIYQIRKVTQ